MMENRYGKIQPLDKVMETIDEGCRLMCGGFGGVGTSPLLTWALKEKGTKEITLICNDAGFPEVGIGPVICSGQIRELIATHIGSNPVAGQKMNSGEMKVTFFPQGTFAEMVRAGGVGLEGILLDPVLAGHDFPASSLITLNEKKMAPLPALTAEVGIIYARKADPFGNLVFEAAAKNTNPLMAMASKTTIVHARELVNYIDPEEIMLPGVFVDMIVTGEKGGWKWAWE